MGVELKTTGDAGLVRVMGLVDEHFLGFGTIAPGIKTLVIDVSAMTRMTSFGVRQWLKAMDSLPKTIGDLYLLGCPTFFVDQLNMVLNFGGPAKVLTVVAPYTCPSCGVESGEMIDVLAERATLAKGGVPEKDCARCGAKLEFDETPESYFSFVTKYAASSIDAGAAQLLAAAGLYTAAEAAAEKPPRIIKLVHGPVTYFRIIGTIGSMFRARPFLVGAEGEVVIDLAEVERFDPLGHREWRRLMKNLVAQVPSLTLVDVSDSFLMVAADSFTVAKTIAVWSVLVPYFCIDCGKSSMESQTLQNARWPLKFPDHVCSTCGGTTQSALRPEALAPLQKANTQVPPASAKLIQAREEILSRALTDANVAKAGDAASASLSADDTILGKYKIVRRLSAGGMAEVFLAKQVGIGGFEKPVALKRILRQLLESRHLAVDMFLNEAKIAGRLMHPNIVQVLDVGEVAGALYLAMEYVHGRDLRDILKKLRSTKSVMPLGDACYIISQIAQALHHAYWSTDLAGKQLAVVHRDVSPHNVIVGYDGTVKLLDFGVAMSAVTEHAETMIAGKWAYMSPEHTTNQQVDHRSDLFSVGVMFYLLCTGNMPFAGNDPREIVKRIRAGAYKPLKQAAPDIPDAVAALVARLLSPNPDDRPQTGQEVVAAINDFTRSYGIEASATRVAQLVGQVFANEPPEPVLVKELSQSSERPLDEHDASATRRVAVGSGSTQAQLPPDERSPMSHSFSGKGLTPSVPSAGWGVDQSVSLARTRSAEFQAPKPAEEDPRSKRPSKIPEMRTRSAPSSTLMWALIIAVVLGGALVALYFLVKPQW
ncbi:MAG TPA: serine/threonine-protein kinase [Kofleriaceae bacterium]|nr:serine/threonine-protein kinase [Kofleriaceae bacterium]